MHIFFACLADKAEAFAAAAASRRILLCVLCSRIVLLVRAFVISCVLYEGWCFRCGLDAVWIDSICLMKVRAFVIACVLYEGWCFRCGLDAVWHDSALIMSTRKIVPPHGGTRIVNLENTSA